jgi:hypothetical protein
VSIAIADDITGYSPFELFTKDRLYDQLCTSGECQTLLETQRRIALACRGAVSVAISSDYTWCRISSILVARCMIRGVVGSLLACLDDIVGNGNMARTSDIGGPAVPKPPWSGTGSPASVTGRSFGVDMGEVEAKVAA